MAVRRIRAVGGLSTDPTALDQPEALRTASNVLLHRPGTIQPRPGFGDTTNVAARTTDFRPIRLVPFGSGVVAQSHDGSTYRLERVSATTVYDTTRTPPGTRGRSSFAAMRSALYLTSDAGLYKLPTIGSSSLDRAGVLTNYAPIVTTKVTVTDDRWAIDADNAVAYRYCWVREDANGYIRRSAPSSRWEMSAASKSVVTLDRVYLPSGIAAGDTFELYRTKGSGGAAVTPGTEYYLAVTYTVTSSDVTNGYVAALTILDEVPDNTLGAVLYTSTSQGGIGESNELPPLAGTIASWANVLWLGDAQTRYSLTVEIVAMHDTTSDEWDIAGMNFRGLTGDFSSGSAVVDNLSSVDGVRKNMWIWQDTEDNPETASALIPASTQVLKVSTKCTVQAAEPNDGDTFTIFGQTFTWRAAPGAGAEIGIGGTQADSATNAATKLAGWDFSSTRPGIDLSASANSATFTIEEAGGQGVPVSEVGGSIAIVYELTMTANALGTSATAQCQVSDDIEIDDVKFYAAGAGASLSAAGVGDAAKRTFEASVTTAGSETNVDLCAETAENLAAAVNAYAVITDTTYGIRAYRDTEQGFGPSTSGGVLTFLRTTPDGASFNVTSNTRTTFLRPRPPGVGGNIPAPDASFPARLFWSRLDQPEAVPLLNYVDIGESGASILALVPLRAALLVWKEDGLWIVTGTGPSSWVVDPVGEYRLLAPDAWCVLGGDCYAWTSRGLVLVNESGVQAVASEPIGATLREYQRLFARGNADPKRGAYMAQHERLGLAILAVPAATDDEYSATWYVLHPQSGRWAEWTRTDRHAAYDPATDGLVVSPGVDGWEVFFERRDEDAAASYRDATESAVSAGVSGTTITITKTDLGPWTPVAGDVVYDTAKARYARVTAVDGTAGGGTKWDLTITDSEFTTPSATVDWHQCIPTVIEWQAQRLPGSGSRWQEEHVHLEADASAYVATWPMVIGGTIGGQTSAATVTATITPLGARSRAIRVGPNRNMVRAYDLFPRSEVACAGVLWRLSEINLHATSQSRRIAR